jgi:hypothetical protein
MEQSGAFAAGAAEAEWAEFPTPQPQKDALRTPGISPL